MGSSTTDILKEKVAIKEMLMEIGIFVAQRKVRDSRFWCVERFSVVTDILG